MNPTLPADHPDREAALAVLDESPICHIGFIEAGEPVVLPALPGRVGDVLYLHGSPDGALLRAAASGRLLSVNAAVLDGVAVARCACRSALNYRSVLFSTRGRPVDDPAEKERALRVITERITPGGWQRGRPPTPAEVAATAVVALPITGLSLRSRSGPPLDAAADRDLPCWAGVVPLHLTAGAAVADTGVVAGGEVPPVLGGGQVPSAGAAPG